MTSQISQASVELQRFVFLVDYCFCFLSFLRYAMALYNQHVCPVDNWCVISFILHVYAHALRSDVSVCHCFVKYQIACEETFIVDRRFMRV